MGVAIKLPRLGRRPAAKNSTRAKSESKRRAIKPGAAQPTSRKKASPQRKPRGQQVQGATRKPVATAEKQPRSFHWLNRILVLLATGIVAIAATQAYLKLQAIPVERISVTGELEHTQTAAVQDMVQPALSGGFLWADLSRVQQQLEALPWIHEASVRRVWPNALEIHVIEQLPIARWGDGAFLNHEGEVFRPSKLEAWQGLPQLRGPQGSAPELMRTYQRLVDLLKPVGLSVAQLTIDERGEVEARLGGGQRLVIGGVDFLARINRFKAVYRSELAGRMGAVESIDLRYARGVAVGFSEPAGLSATTSKEEKA
ncbi:cell division protein FtsQ/DivIB [Pseudohalioglobus lutimaris]|uniref:Cell division protein FtsQ n=1 Tax=Pseudohalioglobus lutimaris TaxID=1737061 RepID=A0A2N5X7A7_9GAMM|nr:FtsQ-type POTRA domain-containing protein [Pseudohalioglobus lutimaris]PLW70373.1 cell division protein FtsQ [Pseudohalioglobus lutimaris]